jgi:uncharacterized membrane protein
MANDVQATIQELVARAAEEGARGLRGGRRSRGRLSGVRGVVAGAGVAALAPVAAKGIRSIRSGALEDFVEELSEKVGASARAAGWSGAGGYGTRTIPGVGRGRRLPVQQSVDIGAPIETVYNQWTQFEVWPRFMHRVTKVSHKDPCVVTFSTRIWGKENEFVARIETQRPDERIKWKVERGISHTGVVTFHELGPRLTRVLVNLDVDPGGVLEHAARALRHVNRATSADLHRFKAFVEVQEVETGAWRGVIENGKVVKEHDAKYDKGREYSTFQDVFKGPRAKKPTASGRGTRRRGSTNGSKASSRSSASSRGRTRSGNHSEGRSRKRS